MKITKRAIDLLRREFGRGAAAVDTCAGTMPLWGQLVLAGYVRQMMPSPLGHPFSYEITEAGQAALISDNGVQ